MLHALGEARALIYLLPLGRGLRWGELRRLRWSDVDIERTRVTIPAASAKSRRAQAVDLHPRLVEALRATRPMDALPTAPALPPRSMPSSVTFDADFEAAGIAKHDAEGRVVDFHALRTTFISWLVMTGAHLRAVAQLSRSLTLPRAADVHRARDPFVASACRQTRDSAVAPVCRINGPESTCQVGWPLHGVLIPLAPYCEHPKFAPSPSTRPVLPGHVTGYVGSAGCFACL